MLVVFFINDHVFSLTLSVAQLNAGIWQTQQALGRGWIYFPGAAWKLSAYFKMALFSNLL